MSAKLAQHWYALPLLSGALLILSFHPFNFWPLAFVALVPLYFFVAGLSHPSLARVFWGGFLTGSLFAFSLSYFTLMQFHWLPEAYLFAWLVKCAVVPITFISGATVGTLSALVFHLLRSRSFLMNALLGAAVYTLTETLLRAVFGGYYLALLAYAAAPLPPLMALSPLLGAEGVSFVIALINGLVVGGIIAWRAGRKEFLPVAAGVLCTIVVLCVYGSWYLGRIPQEGTVRVSVIQSGVRSDIAFGKEHEGVFSFPALEGRVREAVLAGSELVVYPFSPVEGALYRDERPPQFNKQVLAARESTFAHWAAATQGTTTLMTWNTLYTDGVFMNQYEFWKEGRVVTHYTKRHLFPFMDFTPAWAQRIGLYSTAFDMVPGAAEQALVVSGVRVGNIMCSELHDASLAAADAQQAQVLLAVGSEAMFIDAVASNFALHAAQFRAAENGIPVIRGNILGPSALIDRAGRIVAVIPAGQEGLLTGAVAYGAPRTTPYSQFGMLPLLGMMCVILVGAWLSRSYSTEETSQ